MENTAINRNLDSDFKAALCQQLPDLKRYAKHFCNDDMRSDDLVQDTLVRAMEKCHLYREDSNLKAWLFRIMHNLFCNQYKKDNRYQLVDADNVLPTYAVPGNQEQNIDLLMTELAFNKLDEDFQKPLYLIAIKGLSYEKTAALMHTKVGTIKSRINRAREDLLKKSITQKISDLASGNAKDRVNLMQFTHLPEAA